MSELQVVFRQAKKRTYTIWSSSSFRLNSNLIALCRSWEIEFVECSPYALRDLIFNPTSSACVECRTPEAAIAKVEAEAAEAPEVKDDFDIGNLEEVRLGFSIYASFGLFLVQSRFNLVFTHWSWYYLLHVDIRSWQLLTSNFVNSALSIHGRSNTYPPLYHHWRA